MNLGTVKWQVPGLPVVWWLRAAVRKYASVYPRPELVPWADRKAFVQAMQERYPLLRAGQVAAIMGWPYPDPEPAPASPFSEGFDDGFGNGAPPVTSTHTLTPAALTATVIGKNASLGSIAPNTLADTAILALEINRTSKFIRFTFVGGVLPLGTTGLHFKWGVWEFDLPKGAGNYYQTNVANFGTDVVEMYDEMLPFVGQPLGIDLTPRA